MIEVLDWCAAHPLAFWCGVFALLLLIAAWRK